MAQALETLPGALCPLDVPAAAWDLPSRAFEKKNSLPLISAPPPPVTTPQLPLDNAFYRRKCPVGRNPRAEALSRVNTGSREAGAPWGVGRTSRKAGRLGGQRVMSGQWAIERIQSRRRNRQPAECPAKSDNLPCARHCPGHTCVYPCSSLTLRATPSGCQSADK